MLKLKASKAFFPLRSQKDFSFSAVCLLKPVRSRNGHVFSRAASHFLYLLLGTTCTRLQTNRNMRKHVRWKAACSRFKEADLQPNGDGNPDPRSRGENAGLEYREGGKLRTQGWKKRTYS